MPDILFKDVLIVNEGKSQEADLLVKAGRIERIGPSISVTGAVEEVAGNGRMLMPGIVDDQVHFREPGLTHKAEIGTESGAAAAGGVTTFMEMPNTNPPALTQELLQDKYDIAAQQAWTNYSFFMGASNDNLEEVLKTDNSQVCGIKVFMGSSTGNMLVDDQEVLDKLFSSTPILIATHCEDEETVRRNHEVYVAAHPDPDASAHPKIRNEEACYLSSSKAVDLARKHGSRLHILHLTTEKELALFDNSIPLVDKKITSEVCVHHLWFDAADYERLGNRIKCNPAIKSGQRDALFEALLDDRLDIIATDHAPHTAEEKARPYLEAPAGLPLVQHALQVMLGFHAQGKISLERIIEKMCHAPADCFRLAERGYIREGYFADLALVDLEASHTVSADNLLYKCGWSPFEGHTFTGKVDETYVNGVRVYKDGALLERGAGQRVSFNI
jgi:dihydroorotase